MRIAPHDAIVPYDEIVFPAAGGAAPRRAAPPYIAIDDLALQAMNPKLADVHFVRTNDKDGLTRAKAEEAVRKLREQASHGGTG